VRIAEHAPADNRHSGENSRRRRFLKSARAFSRAIRSFRHPIEPMKKNHAFTLIELLVVISIIAVLAGLAMKVFPAVLERARATEDKNNLSSIGKGIMMYLNDNDDSMFELKGTGATNWPSLLQAKYVKDWKAFRSPFDKPSPARPKTDIPPLPISYGMSEKVFDTFVGKWKGSPSSVVIVAPAVDFGVPGKNVQFLASARSDAGNAALKITSPTGTDMGTHQSRTAINVLFADGHVEQMTWTKYVANGTTAEKQRWDPMYEDPGTP
jgi:prepilin-type N-terminal cleavage/methylation domain-containing protein/prepilin-type processing-associated H-X9-DG protein